jgi:hypothetical protein
MRVSARVFTREPARRQSQDHPSARSQVTVARRRAGRALARTRAPEAAATPSLWSACWTAVLWPAGKHLDTPRRRERSSHGRRGQTRASPRLQSSRGGGGTAASPRRCTSRAVRGRPHRRAIASPRVGLPSRGDRSMGLGHPRDRLAKSNRRHCEPPATPLPRTEESRPARRDGRIPREMRKLNHAAPTAAVVLLLC